jgi:hypothetical protein
MKLKNIISVALLFIYSLTVCADIGVFHCGCIHSEQLVMLSGRAAFPCSSSGKDCCRHHEEEDKTGCCPLQYKSFEIDRQTVARNDNLRARELSLPFSPFVPAGGWAADTWEYAAAGAKHSPPPDLYKIPLIYLHTQLRL